jgi:lysophospholipase L1-like esterase
MLRRAKGYKIEVNQSSASSPVCNVGLNGADATSFSFLARMKNIGNPDVIAIYGGTNDAVGTAALGEYKYADWTADDLKTFRPAYAYMLDYLITNHSDADIVVIIQPNLDNWKPGIEESIIEICEHYGVQYVLLPSDLSTCDNFVHPDKKGMQQIYEAIKDYFD